MTVASNSRKQKVILKKFMQHSCDHLFKMPFMLHDFGFRGVSSTESAAIGGCAHLVNFLGTDTMAALMCAKKHYHENFAGFSVPASEHSTITSWGRTGEKDAMANMLKQYD